MNSIILQLDDLINGDFTLLRERVDIECKLAIGQDGKGGLPKSLWETYSAFANTEGGIIILGAKELKDGSYEAYGIDNLARIKTDLFNTLNNTSKVNKNLLSDKLVREWQVNGKNLLVIAVPRASRKQQPIYLNNNPLNNTYIRQNEGDYVLDDDQVKRMLAEQVSDAQDDEILLNFGINDLAVESLRAYRQRYSNLNPNAEMNDLTDIEFLRRIGAYGVNRDSGIGGLTKAGLLMFGQWHNITEIFPNYLLDYQEQSQDKTIRWIDRVIPDHAWSGNLFDFYRKVALKLVQDLKIPFIVKDGIRQDDTPVHIALREALVNSLVHADYSDRVSLQIIKRPDGFRFRNAGLMRIPIEQAIYGGMSDCRNRNLQKMFRMIHAGEQAGSGIPKILAGWETQHWQPPYLYELRQPNQTVLELKMLDLFPQDTMRQLTSQFGTTFTDLNKEEQAALAIAHLEGTVTHKRLASMSQQHSADISKCLQNLVKLGFLNRHGSGRGAVYQLADTDVVKPEQVFNELSLGLNASSLGLNVPSLGLNAPSLGLNVPCLGQNNSGSASDNISSRDEFGRLCNDKISFPIIDSLSELSEEFRVKLFTLAHEARIKQRLPLERMQAIILQLCSEQFFTIAALSEVLNRKAEALRKRYLSPMVKANQLCMAFPTTPTHEKQAYRTNTELNQIEN